MYFADHSRPRAEAEVLRGSVNTRSSSLIWPYQKSCEIAPSTISCEIVIKIQLLGGAIGNISMVDQSRCITIKMLILIDQIHQK